MIRKSVGFMPERRVRSAVAAVLLILGLRPGLPAPGESDETRGIAWKAVGPYGGDLRQVVVDPLDADTLFVSTGDGKVYRSQDGGKNWVLPHGGLRQSRFTVDALLADASPQRLVFAGTWSTGLDHRGGVFRSSDRGETWTELPGMSGHAIRALAQCAAEPSVLVAGALDGVFLSQDFGESWSRISPVGHPEIRNVESVAVHPRNPKVIFVGTWHLPWRTADGGANWERAGSRETGMVDDSDIFSIMIDHHEPQRMFMSACTGLYESTDGSRTWSKIRGIPSNSKRTRIVYQHPTRSKTIYAGTTEGLWRSTDGGTGWRLASSRTLVVNGLVIPREAPDRVYVAADGVGLLLSHDSGSNFQPSNFGLANRSVAATAADPETFSRLYAGLLHEGSERALWVTDDEGASWRIASTGLTASDVFCIHTSPGKTVRVLAGTSQGLFRSTNRGGSWSPWGGVPAGADNGAGTRVGSGRTRAPGSTRARAETKRLGRAGAAAPEPLRDHIVQIAPDPFRPAQLLVVGWKGLYRVDESTGSAVRLYRCPVGVRALTVAGGTFEASGRLWLGTSQGLLESDEEGKSWRPVPVFGTGPHAIQAIEISAGSPAALLVGTDIGVVRKRAGSLTWERRGGGLPPISVSCITIDPANERDIWVADQKRGGLYLSRDDGDTWHQVDTGFAGDRIWSLRFLEDEPWRILAGSIGGSLYLGRRDVKPDAEGGANDD
ncbi:MAG: hypothetical protein HY650_14470 [Acidobacteria bacterium]|nr:hypothetical protein [Acidobacteriota bacterium]